MNNKIYEFKITKEGQNKDIFDDILADKLNSLMVEEGHVFQSKSTEFIDGNKVSKTYIFGSRF